MIKFKKTQTICSIIAGIMSVIITGYFMWLGATLFAISGDQRDLQARMKRVEDDTVYIRSRVDAVAQPASQKYGTAIVKR